MSPPLAISYLGPLLIAALFFLLLLLEALSPLRRRKRPQAPRLLLNLSLSATVFAVGGLAVKPVALGGAAWTGAQIFGLLHFLPLPFWAQFILGFLIMDLTFYYWHRLNHTRALLWRFHIVHHVDPDLDVSTSFRFHPVEILYSTLFRVLQVGLAGISPLIYVTYELAFQGATLFHHSNVRIPLSWERRVNKVLVTPRMHGVHHSVVGSETNSNYAVIFSWWDRLHRSLRLNVKQADLIIGVPGYLLPADNRFWPLLKIPFLRQRPYWRWPSGKAVTRPAVPGAAEPRIMLE
jgi:sterol desaturase/sphingolipid hydroxylase (fatty acid hydroxylase superfamily)